MMDQRCHLCSAGQSAYCRPPGVGSQPLGIPGSVEWGTRRRELERSEIQSGHRLVHLYVLRSHGGGFTFDDLLDADQVPGSGQIKLLPFSARTLMAARETAKIFGVGPGSALRHVTSGWSFADDLV